MRRILGPKIHWRVVKVRRRRLSNPLLELIVNLARLVFSLPVVAFVLVAMLTISAGMRPGNGPAQQIVRTLARYENSYKHRIPSIGPSESTLPRRSRHERSDVLYHVAGVRDSCVSGTLKASEASAGSYISTWVKNAKSYRYHGGNQPLDRYANSNKSGASGIGTSKSVISRLNRSKGSNAFAYKNVIKGSCVPGTIQSTEAGAGSYISAWVTDARLAGDNIAATAEWYRYRYLRGNRNNR